MAPCLQPREGAQGKGVHSSPLPDGCHLLLLPPSYSELCAPRCHPRTLILPAARGCFISPIFCASLALPPLFFLLFLPFIIQAVVVSEAGWLAPVASQPIHTSSWPFYLDARLLSLSVSTPPPNPPSLNKNFAPDAF